MSDRTGPTRPATPPSDWERVYRLDAMVASEPDAEGWITYDLSLRPMDRRGRTNGRARHLTTMQVGGPPECVDLTGLTVGLKYDFRYTAGPTPTTRAVIRPWSPE